jgi:hypothetical protein
VWADGKVVLAGELRDVAHARRGPIRVLFELDYDAVRRRREQGRRHAPHAARRGPEPQSHRHDLQAQGGAKDVTAAIGLRRPGRKGVEHGKDFNKEHGWLTKFEDVEKKAGKQGPRDDRGRPLLIQQETAARSN